MRMDSHIDLYLTVLLKTIFRNIYTGPNKGKPLIDDSYYYYLGFCFIIFYS